jgi:hypothetical protein
MATAYRLAARLTPRAATVSRPLSTIPVTEVASVLKLNVGNEETALKLDAKMKVMATMMKVRRPPHTPTRPALN